MFIKLGEAFEIKLESAESCIPQIDEKVLDNFRKVAANLRKVAPKANDFLYFSAVMMHAAEASALNDDGSPKLNVRGEPVQVGWDQSGGTWKWMTNDSSIRPYKNCNGDIFPEQELVKAYKKWVHKPLCIDHKSSSVDHTRGFIVDTYYDRNLKRVIALCALDKANYPELARKVSTGMQTAVSMGTAVGRAICAEVGCHRVARSESDFCTHMKNKSGYGEINVDLNPIELSIVVNGADPRANIKHVLAAANTLNSYVDSKVRELQKIADLEFSATLSVQDPKGFEGGGSSTVTIQNNNLSDFKRDLDHACEQLSQIVAQTKNSQKDTNELASNQSSGTSVISDDTEVTNVDTGLAPPTARYASTNLGADLIVELFKVTAAIESKINNMKQSLDKLAKSNKQEETMPSNEMNKKGYYQGTEEPTPGQPKYTKDPGHMAYEDDKHMHGQKPFPDMGPVDGMHPGVESSGVSELERKKMLARAEAEERAQKRTAIVNMAKQAVQDKRAYFQNGDEKNPGAPTPGKPKYTKDPGHMAYEDDKHMHGQKPFPDVGKVDGLHPSPDSAETSDELKRKEMLRRANTLHGIFVDAARADGTRDRDNSAWEIRLGDKIILTASVKDLSGGRSEMMYDTIKTKEFGQRLLEKVKVMGSDKVRALVKNSQAVQPAPEAAPPADVAPAAPANDVAAPPANDVAAPVGEDMGGSGDPKENATELAEQVRDMSSDLAEVVKALTGEQEEMGAAPGGEMAAAASDFSLDHMNVLRSELNQSLTQKAKEILASLEDHQQELDYIVSMYDKGSVTASNEEFVGSVVEDVLAEAKTSLAEGFRVMTAFVKYARGTQSLVKRAEIEAELNAMAEGDESMHDMGTDGSEDLMSLIQGADQELSDVEDMMADDHMDSGEEALAEDLDKEFGLGDGGLESEMLADDNDLMAKPDELKDLNVKPGTTVQVTAGFETKAGRAALRAKLAADALGKQDDGQVQDMSKAKFSDMLDQADRLADGQTELDVKPSDNLGLVETLPEVNKAMMDLAKAPPKVRREAEAIHKLISEGKLASSDLDALVAEGLDKDAVSYYKKYYGQVEGGGEFASELVKEHTKAHMENEINTYKLKLARAYEVAYDMVDRGLCHNDKIAIAAQVDEIMKFNDENFDTLKRVVARHAPVMRKEAGRIPQVGMIGSGEMVVNASAQEDDWSLLSAALAKTSKRMF